MDNREQLIAAWLDEAQTLFISARSHFNRADQVLALGATGVAAAIGIAANQKGLTEDLLVGLPTVVLFLLTYVVQTTGDVIVMETARLRIEEELALTMGQSALIYQRWANRRQRRTRTLGIPVMFLLVTAGAVALIVAGGMAAPRLHAHGAVLLYWMITSGWLVALILSVIDTARAERVTRENLRGWPAGRPSERRLEDLWFGERQIVELYDGRSISWPWTRR